MGFSSCDLGTTAIESRSAIEWEESNCLLCGGKRWAHLVEAADAMEGGSGLWFAVVQCQQCGLCFTNPRPTPAAMEQFYPPTYQPHRTSRTRRRKHRAARWSSLFPLASFLPSLQRSKSERKALPWHGQGRLLDFGCGGGSYLERMHRQGWRVTGLDASSSAVQRIRSELGLEALVGSLPHPKLRPNSFDVITMWQSLEHVHDPLAVLRQARRLLVAGGKLLVAVPNIDSLPFRWFGHAWYGLDLPRHLTHFSPATLVLMLQRAGFQTGPVRMLRHSDWLRSSAKRAHRCQRGPYWHRWLISKPASRLASWYSYLTEQSDCVCVVAEKGD